MKICPYCKEEIKQDAVKCRYCQSNIDSDPEDNKRGNDKVVLIIDKGVLYFGKFVLVILSIFVVVAVTFYGVDLKKASEEVQKSKDVLNGAKEQLIQLDSLNTGIKALRKQYLILGVKNLVDKGVLKAMDNLHETGVTYENLDTALSYFRESKDSLYIVKLLEYMIAIDKVSGNHEKISRNYEEAIKISENKREIIKTAKLLNDYSDYEKSRNNTDKANELYRQADKVRQGALINPLVDQKKPN